MLPDDSQSEAQQYLDQAYAANERGDQASALPACERAIQLCPHWAEAHNLQGLILDGLQRPREAIQAYQTALAYDLNFEEARLNLQTAVKELNETTAVTSLPFFKMITDWWAGLKCIDCGHPIAEDDIVCAHCGAKLDEPVAGLDETDTQA